MQVSTAEGLSPRALVGPNPSHRYVEKYASVEQRYRLIRGAEFGPAPSAEHSESGDDELVESDPNQIDAGDEITRPCEVDALPTGPSNHELPRNHATRQVEQIEPHGSSGRHGERHVDIATHHRVRNS